VRNSGGTTLITGGAGYIGMLVAEKLLAASRDVRALDLLLRDQQGCAEARIRREDPRGEAAA
jgi:nucleoside-diphosphate-sugar epimerase